MTTGEAVPDRAGFARLARGSRLVPVTRRLLADGETPVGVYRKLAGGRPGTFLLESAEHGRSWSRWSFVGVRSEATLSERDGRAVWTGTPPPGAPADGDPLEVLGATWRALLGATPAGELPDLPPLTGGLVGYLGYDVVRRIERLPAYATDDLGLPELTMLVATDVAVVDHYEASVLLVANALVPPDAPADAVDAAYDDAVARLDAMTRDLATPALPSVAVTRPVPPAEHVSRTPPGQYQPAVKAALDAVRAGEVFQVQIGQRFETRTDADALAVYRVLRTLNPSPYMYLLRLDGFDIVVLDHFAGAAILIANAVLPAKARKAEVTAAYHQAVGRLDAMTTALSRPTPPLVSTIAPTAKPVLKSRTPEGEYQKSVETAKEAIRAGDCFQIVVAQRFEADCEADAMDVYRVLRTTNPSPYMYLLRYDGFDIVGSSPESHLKITVGPDKKRTAMLHPIAGTRPRGETSAQDSAYASELIADPKERSEHVMLVDLGRNDLGRVSRPGTVTVPEFASIERYSHVMHIVSTVVGEVRDEHTAFDALCATFPAGTLSGAPKVRAMEIIEELEPIRRGLYGGTVGYLGFGGDLDMAIAIRTALIRGRRAYVQAGAGIVADSDPAAEEQETRNKAAAVLAAIASAETLRAAR